MLEIEQISFGHLQWIYYRQALDGYDSQGNFVQIQHAYFRGEIDFQGLKPDGYLFKDGKHYFYEYQGKKKFLNESSLKRPHYIFRLLLARLLLSSTSQALLQFHVTTGFLS